MLARIIKKLRAPLVLLFCLGISACSWDKWTDWDSWDIPGLYRIPIQQGNVITVQMLQELKLGMDKRKVSFILGTPLVIDAFHIERWDYYYSYKSGDGEFVQQRASLYFDNDKLSRIDANMDSKIDFHTVTEATQNALIVPPKKKGGFFAALTPAFLERDEENEKQEEIAKSLSSGVDEDQPGSADTAAEPEVLDPALAAPDAIESAAADIGTGAITNEVYAPNSSAELGAPKAAQTEAGADPAVAAKIASQTRYLEQLFDNFGTTPATAPPAAASVITSPAESAPAEPTAAEPIVPTQPVRD
jgi:outer membrane protein assembly factor BamE